MPRFLRTWWPLLTFALGVLFFVGVDVADRVAADRELERSRRDHDEWMKGYTAAGGRLGRGPRSDWDRDGSLLIWAWSSLLVCVALFSLVWAGYGIWSAVTGKPVTW